MAVLVTICARAGSVGVKDKNRRLVAGKPLIVHTIEQAMDWGRADQIVVSTDSKEIANLCRSYGVEIPFMRPAELAEDDSTSMDVVEHALKWLKENDNEG